MTGTDAADAAGAAHEAVAKPSLELLRGLSDEHVLRALMTRDRMTRAELAVETGISKPTVGESVRRLVGAGVLVDTGERTTGRGRVGSYYALAPDAGCAMAVSLAPEGLIAELVDTRGNTLGRERMDVDRPARSPQVRMALAQLAGTLADEVRMPIRVATVSAADPVERASGRLVHLPYSPFLVGELSPVDILALFVDGPVAVDNDVNWAARAEQDAAGGQWRDVVYLYLGEGIGGALVSDGEVRRGHDGLAGEVAYVMTTGPGDVAMRLLDVFGALDLLHDDSTAIDVPALVTAFDSDPAVFDVVVRAIGGVVASVVALSDPELVVLGGPWGGRTDLADAVRALGIGLRASTDIRTAAVVDDAPLRGARATAVRMLQDSVVDYRRTRPPR